MDVNLARRITKQDELCEETRSALEWCKRIAEGGSLMSQLNIGPNLQSAILAGLGIRDYELRQALTAHIISMLEDELNERHKVLADLLAEG